MLRTERIPRNTQPPRYAPRTVRTAQGAHATHDVRNVPFTRWAPPIKFTPLGRGSGCNGARPAGWWWCGVAPARIMIYDNVLMLCYCMARKNDNNMHNCTMTKQSYVKKNRVPGSNVALDPRVAGGPTAPTEMIDRYPQPGLRVEIRTRD